LAVVGKYTKYVDANSISLGSSYYFYYLENKTPRKGFFVFIEQSNLVSMEFYITTVFIVLLIAAYIGTFETGFIFYKKLFFRAHSKPEHNDIRHIDSGELYKTELLLCERRSMFRFLYQGALLAHLMVYLVLEIIQFAF
jgi:hypothetical protein